MPLRIQNITTPGTANCVKYQCDSIIVAAILPAIFNHLIHGKLIQLIIIRLILPTQQYYLSTGATVTLVFWRWQSFCYLMEHASHQYAQPGKYYVCLRVQINTTCYKYQCDSVTVPAPVADCNYISAFTFTKSSNDNQVYTFTPVIILPLISNTPGHLVMEMVRAIILYNQSSLFSTWHLYCLLNSISR